MFIDFDIPIPPNTPKPILEDLEELQRLYDAGDWCYFDLKWEGVESRIKNAMLVGKLSKKDGYALFHRYGNMV